MHSKDLPSPPINSISKPGQDTTTSSRVHSLSRQMARDCSINEALILKYLVFKIAKSKQLRKGRRWYYATLDELHETFPYLGRSTINDALKRLNAANYIEIDHFNAKRYDHTRWFALGQSPGVQNANRDLIYFRSEDALQHRVVGALVLHNIAYWVAKNREKDPDYDWHGTSPAQLAKHLPADESTIRRALNRLVKAGALEDEGLGKNQSSRRYRLVDQNRVPANADDGEVANPDQANAQPAKPDEVVADSDIKVANPNRGMAIPHKGVANPNDNTHWKESLEKNLLERQLLERDRYVDRTPQACGSSSASQSLSDGQEYPAMGVSVNPFKAILYRSSSPEGNVSNSDKDSEIYKCECCHEASTLTPSVVVSAAERSQRNLSNESLSHRDKEKRQSMSQQLTELHAIATNCKKCLGETQYERLRDHFYDSAHAWIRQRGVDYYIPFQNAKDDVEVLDAIKSDLDPMIQHLTESLELKKTDNIDKYVQAKMTATVCTWAFGAYLCCYPEAYRLSIEIYRIETARREQIKELEKEKRLEREARYIEERSKLYMSQDEAKESQPLLSPGEKVKVFRNAIKAFNEVGRYDPEGNYSNNIIQHNNKGFDGAFQFFKANPSWCVRDLMMVLERCIELMDQPEPGGDDPHWHARRGHKVDFALEHLDCIVQSLSLVGAVPRVNSLDYRQLFGRSKNVNVEETHVSH